MGLGEWCLVDTREGASGVSHSRELGGRTLGRARAAGGRGGGAAGGRALSCLDPGRSWAGCVRRPLGLALLICETGVTVPSLWGC